MKFSTREDIEAPIETVFLAVTDFGSFERAALRRGAQVARADTLQSPEVGMKWQARFRFRRKMHDLEAQVMRFEAPEVVEIESQTHGLTATLSIELLQLTPRQTRMHMVFDIKPKTFSARVFLQSVRLAKTSLTRRFKVRIQDFARSVEQR